MRFWRLVVTCARGLFAEVWFCSCIFLRARLTLIWLYSARLLGFVDFFGFWLGFYCLGGLPCLYLCKVVCI